MDNRLERYPTSHFDPKPDCRKCKGAGEYDFKNRMVACICIFVDHSVCNELGISLANFAKKELASLQVS